MWSFRAECCDYLSHSFFSDFTNFLADFGAIPLLYDAGKSTVVQPVYVSDVAEGVTRILRHPDAEGQTFEFAG